VRLAFIASLLVLGASAVVRADLPTLTGPTAREELSHGESSVRAEAARLLGYHGEHRAAVEALIAALPSERDAVVRREIVLALARRGDPRAIAVLVEALSAPGAPNRVVVAHALASFPREASINALAAALAQSETRAAAHRALVNIGTRSVPTLLLAAEQRQPSIPAIEALGEIGDQRALPRLIELTRHDGAAVRVAAVQAIAAMRAERGGPAVAALVDDGEADVRLAAVMALGIVGGPPHVELLREKLAEDQPLMKRAALRALTALSPDDAVPHLERFAADGSPGIGPLAIELVLQMRVASAASLLHGLLREGSRAQEAASALAELEAGSGLAVLVHIANEAPDIPGVMRALAVCLRHHGEVADSDLVERARATLSAGEGTRGLLLRAIARDDSVRDRIVRWISEGDAEERAVSALAAEVHPHGAFVEPLLAAFEEEDDPEAYRRIASALVAHRVAVAAPILLITRFDDPAVGSEAMALAAEAYAHTDRWTQRRLGAAFRHALRSSDVRLRTGAAWALAQSGDRSAHRALAVALDDVAPEVRHAAARALSALGADASREGIERRLRVEEDEIVAQALRDALTMGRPFPARGLPGDQVLRVRVVTGTAILDSRIPVDVVLPDGRFLRMRTLSSGELLIVDLPSGSADVRVRVGGSA
jgi:HEAT repeat protein